MILDQYIYIYIYITVVKLRLNQVRLVKRHAIIFTLKYYLILYTYTMSRKPACFSQLVLFLCLSLMNAAMKMVAAPEHLLSSYVQ